MLELLDESDARLIRDRIGGARDESKPPHNVVEPLEGDKRYGQAVVRFSSRLSWVVAREYLGVSPAQRGVRPNQVSRGFPKVVASRLRLPMEVVARIGSARVTNSLSLNKKLSQNGRGLSRFCAVFGAKWDCPPLSSRFEIVSKGGALGTQARVVQTAW